MPATLMPAPIASQPTDGWWRRGESLKISARASVSKPSPTGQCAASQTSSSGPRHPADQRDPMLITTKPATVRMPEVSIIPSARPYLRRNGRSASFP